MREGGPPVSPPGSDLALPTGLSPGDLDVFVRFDFPYPNVVCGEPWRAGQEGAAPWALIDPASHNTGGSSERQDQRDQEHGLPW